MIELKVPSDDEIIDLSELFKVFGDFTRAKILCCLSQKELCVLDISSLINMSKSAVSHQLRILRQAHLVKTRRQGKEIYYSLDDDHVEKIISIGLDHINE